MSAVEMIYAMQEATRRLSEALYTAEDFISRVTRWDGDTPEEQAEVLAEVRRALGGGEPIGAEIIDERHA